MSYGVHRKNCAQSCTTGFWALLAPDLMYRHVSGHQNETLVVLALIGESRKLAFRSRRPGGFDSSWQRGRRLMTKDELLQKLDEQLDFFFPDEPYPTGPYWHQRPYLDDLFDLCIQAYGIVRRDDVAEYQRSH